MPAHPAKPNPSGRGRLTALLYPLEPTAALEKDYRRSTIARSLGRLRFAYLSGFAISLLAWIADPVFYTGGSGSLFLLPLPVLFIGALALSGWRHFPRVAQGLNDGLFALILLAPSLRILVTGTSGPLLHCLPLFLPLLLWGYGLLRPRFLSGSLVALGTSGLLVAATGPAPTRLAGIALLLMAIVIGMGIALFQERAARKTHRLRVQLEELSTHDRLTGLRNRHYFDEFVSNEIARFILDRKRTQGKETRSSGNAADCYGLYMLDVDHIKEINDTHGHAAGDAVLRQFSALLKESVRGADAVFRWGGEEFIILLRNAHTAYLPVFAAKIVAAVRKHAFTLPHGDPLAVTASAGFLSIPFGSLDNPEQLIQQADRALSAAKQTGRDRAVQALSREDVIEMEPVLRVFERTGGGNEGPVLF